ncbi:MAG: flagellar hook basal-body protein [Planctomycetota bacterium]
MNYGLYLSASGALTSMHRLDALTNNLANVNTVGFKPHSPAVRQRDPVRIEDGLFRVESNELLERLGGGVQLAPTRIGFTQGTLRQTGNPLDVAVNGEGFFMLRGDQNGQEAELLLTRDGRLAIDSRGTLVQATSGRPLLGLDSEPIRLDQTQEVRIDSAGRIFQGDDQVGALRFVDVPDKQRLTKRGDGMFGLTNDAVAGLAPANGLIKQGEVEGSAVDEVRALMRVQGAAGDARANLAMIGYHDRLMDRAINRLGRVS